MIFRAIVTASLGIVTGWYGSVGHAQNAAGSAPIAVAATGSGPNATRICHGSASKELYNLQGPPSLPAGVTFLSDWAARKISGGFDGVQSMDRCRMQPDPSGFLTWHNKTALRVEVNPGDDPLSPRSNSERAEVLTMQNTNGANIHESSSSGIQYYATSYYFPNNWGGQQLPWHAFGGAAVCGTGSKNQCNSWSYVLQLYFGWSLAAAQFNVGGPQLYAFNGNQFKTNQQIALGKWTDFVFQIDWSNGAYTIYRRDEAQTQFVHVLTGTTTPASGLYFKQGLYRGGKVNDRTDVLWIGPTARGASVAAVELAAFGTNNGIAAIVPR